jgi:hypothetical protein
LMVLLSSRKKVKINHTFLFFLSKHNHEIFHKIREPVSKEMGFFWFLSSSLSKGKGDWTGM